MVTRRQLSCLWWCWRLDLNLVTVDGKLELEVAVAECKLVSTATSLVECGDDDQEGEIRKKSRGLRKLVKVSSSFAAWSQNFEH